MSSDIGLLPNEVLIRICEYLDAKTMKNAALVSKKFYEATTNKFNLLLSNKTQSNGEKTLWIDEIMVFERRFQSFDVTFDDRHYDKSLKMLSQIISKSAPIKRLVLRNIQFESPNHFLNILRKMASLEELELSKVTFKPIEAQSNPTKRLKLTEIEPILMRRLETITLCKSDYTILSCLIAPKTTSLKTELTPSSISESLRDVLVNFMKPLKHLKSIDFDCNTHWKLFSAPFPGKPLFKLTKWKTIHKNFHIIEDELINFLTPHLPTLEHLEINCVTKEFLLEILKKCHRSKRLKLYVDIPPNVEFFKGLKPLLEVKDLKVRGNFESVESAKVFLSLFPNLQKLNLSSYQGATVVSTLLPFINQINPEIKLLSISKFIDTSDVKFKCVESFRIKDLEDPKALIVFLKKNPKIETLCVSYFNGYEKFIGILDLLLEETYVIHLHLSGELETMKEVFDKIKVDYKNLKTLQLSIYIGRDNDIPVLKFEFPEDRSEWDVNRSNDFDGIVPLPWIQWDAFVPEDIIELVEDLNIADEGLNENNHDIDG